MKKLRERIKKYKLIKADISNIDLQLQELKENIYGLTELNSSERTSKTNKVISSVELQVEKC